MNILWDLLLSNLNKEMIVEYQIARAGVAGAVASVAGAPLALWYSFISSILNHFHLKENSTLEN